MSQNWDLWGKKKKKEKDVFFERRLGWRKWEEATIGRVRNVKKDNKASKYMASDVLQSLSSGSQACAWPPPPKSGWQPVLFLWSHKPNLEMRRLRVVLLASRGAPGRMDGQAHKASWCHTGLVPPAPTHCFLLIRSNLKEKGPVSQGKERLHDKH